MSKDRRKTPTVKVGNVLLGGSHPIVIQSMTNTPTSSVEKTTAQTIDLIKAGAEIVRMTINDEASAIAAPKIINAVRKRGFKTPIIGDFHFNGHLLLSQYPRCAKALDKYRINPGNVGKGKTQNTNFKSIILTAKKYKKPVRIGVNSGSLDQDLLSEITAKNRTRKKKLSSKEIIYQAMVTSALRSAKLAQKLGLPKNKIVLSVKMSDVGDTITVYERLAKKCDYVLHLGITEAGGKLYGMTASIAALAVLLQQGIGDTIRISITPGKTTPRTREVKLCRALLQSMGLRHYSPTVISCPGCGRTASNEFQKLAETISSYVEEKNTAWIKKYPGVEKLKIAVMGCIVNGPGESRHADFGICLPGASEKPQVLIFENGRKTTILNKAGSLRVILRLLDKYISGKYRKK